MKNIPLVYKHYKKSYNEKIFNVMDPNRVLKGFGAYLPLKKDCLKLIKDLKWFITSYTDQESGLINTDVHTILNGYIPPYLPQRVFIPKTKERRKIPGYIYFLQDDIGRIKIGRTKEINKRILHIGGHLPVAPILFHFFETSNTVISEKNLHEKYEKYRLSGEWFNLPKEELLLIKNMKEV